MEGLRKEAAQGKPGERGGGSNTHKYIYIYIYTDLRMDDLDFESGTKGRNRRSRSMLSNGCEFWNCVGQ